jgi:opacity protein-like surface antigen
MKAKYLIIVQLFIFCFSFSQEKDQQKGWYAGPNISGLLADRNYHILKRFYNDVINIQYFYSYSVGADGMYAFGRKHTLTFGIHYQELRYAYTNSWVADPIRYPGVISSSNFSYLGKYLLLPVHMDFCLLKGKFSPFIMAGLTPQFISSSASINKTPYFKGTTVDERKDFSVGWQVGLGLDVNLNKARLRVFVYDTGEDVFYNPPWHYWSVRGGISYYLKTSRR